MKIDLLHFLATPVSTNSVLLSVQHFFLFELLSSLITVIFFITGTKTRKRQKDLEEEEKEKIKKAKEMKEKWEVYWNILIVSQD